MTIRNTALADKLFVLGIDGLDPRYSRKMLREGKMPNMQKFIDRGAAREDLMMLGGHPTVTPPMWATLSTGAYANVHGITGYNRQGSAIDKIVGNFDSRNCTAEPVWNVLAENGIKTCVFHWPGNAWPPTSDSENLYVCDGSTPGGLGMGAATISDEFICVADARVEAVTFAKSATADLDKACIVKPEEAMAAVSASASVKDVSEKTNILLGWADGLNASTIPDQLSAAISPITEPKNWNIDVPEGAKEFILLLSKGMLRRPGLVLKNAEGKYDRVALYKNKKAAEPFVVLEEGKIKSQIYDQAVSFDGETKDCNYNMKLLNITEDGSHLEIFISNGTDMHADFIFSPSSLFYEIAENVGYIAPSSYCGNNDPKMITDCMFDNWNVVCDWQSRAIHYLMEQKECRVVFSHLHSIDMQEHRFIRFLSKGDKDYDIEYDAKEPEMYQKFMEDIYVQADNYIGTFLHLLDEGWTVVITSDHAQVCPEHRPPMLCDPQGVSTGVMGELGYTVLKTDENGNKLKEIDWDKTRAVANRECNIYLNIKGRDKHVLADGTVVDGIVDPADKWELEEQIITDLYSYKDKKTGHRIVAMALRNKDAVLVGYGGPECGDICYWIADGYNNDHADGLSTAWGDEETSLSPIFIAAGKGIKEGFVTDRMIRQVDLAPTVSALFNVRMPAQCEGAPVYQIFDQEF
ncbi:MAG: alkaline phosphatase family protein [Peptococcaceae bacterium]|nr:alkaline phosphatase family protein [Peptococcaceae bacterium]MBO5140011.1 alkaline phosphatase family protein [Peptococcaceae bacterium]MBO5301801.1 alkaline phosphatase family protein [Peptococcaceae bacterium]MBO5429134.1 alkaline phosphatase family protein [Peptococcaceae bacterium]MBP3341037.1 alkaline phosphatase family protein [Peptococcaceae bacterium]